MRSARPRAGLFASFLCRPVDAGQSGTDAAGSSCSVPWKYRLPIDPRGKAASRFSKGSAATFNQVRPNFEAAWQDGEQPTCPHCGAYPVLALRTRGKGRCPKSPPPQARGARSNSSRKSRCRSDNSGISAWPACRQTGGNRSNASSAPRTHCRAVSALLRGRLYVGHPT